METVNITLAIPKELHERMREHSDISWSALIRHTLEHKLSDLELLDKLTSQSKMTEEDALEIGRLIKRSAAKKLGFL
jgi:predicted CopG family antitoxin